MRKYNSLFFSVLLLLAACHSGPPDGIIEQNKMVNLLTDVHIIDGSLYATVQVPDSLYYHGNGKFNALFKRYHVDSAQFRKSFKYYTAKPDIMLDMYNKVVDKLQFKIDSINGVKAKPTPRLKPQLRNAVPSQ